MVDFRSWFIRVPESCIAYNISFTKSKLMCYITVYTIKPASVTTSIKQLLVLCDPKFNFLSEYISY